MKKKELLKRIELLEKRVTDLESRPFGVITIQPQPAPLPVPTAPWIDPFVNPIYTQPGLICTCPKLKPGEIYIGDIICPIHSGAIYCTSH